MSADFGYIFQWWGTLFLVGAAAFPLTQVLFGKLDSRLRGNDGGGGWYDSGYLFAKAVGLATVTYILYLFGTLHILPFTQAGVWLSMTIVFLVGILLNLKLSKGKNTLPPVTLVLEEVFFLAALVLWSWVKAHEPSIHGLEKFMDFGFTKSILNTRFFPATDMWYAGSTINYYYFGHIVMAMLTRLSGIDLTITFNLMLATIFAFTATMSFSIGYQLYRVSGIAYIAKYKIRNTIYALISGTLTLLLVTLAGNMQTLYAFTQGYTGDNVKPFWTLLWQFKDFWRRLPEGMNTYWYANATRFIPYTIHEFPSYSFVVSDLHGHVLSLPFVLLAIALLIVMFGNPSLREVPTKSGRRGNLLCYLRDCFAPLAMTNVVFYGFLLGVLLMTNALDGPIYFSLFAAAMTVSGVVYQVSWKKIGLTLGSVAGIFVVTSLPFLIHFKSFVSGIAVNCPPAILSNTKIGPILFEGVEKCQHSPFWMMWLLWGFFIFCGGILLIHIVKHIQSNTKVDQKEMLLGILFGFSILLIIFPEFFYFKDIYPMHFRSNTMFKLGYQAFIMFSIVSGYTIMKMLFGDSERRVKFLFFVLLAPQLFLVAIYPYFSIRSYFNSLRTYEGLYGLGWLKIQHPDDWEGINWFNARVSSIKCQVSGTDQTQIMIRDTCDMTQPVIVEADGDSYTDFNRYSAFTGTPTIVGWAVHEWLWRGTYDVVAPRREEVKQIYESPNIAIVRGILAKYHVRYIIVGQEERDKYKTLDETKFLTIGRVVFTQGSTNIIMVSEDNIRKEQSIQLSTKLDNEYTVTKGDSLWSIAFRTYGNGNRWAEIAELNKLKNPSMIHSGNILLLPN